jgi:hypothetical protein
VGSREPFDEKAFGEAAFEQAMAIAVAKKRFSNYQSKVIWRCPDRTLIRYVRVVLEQQNFLTLTQVGHYHAIIQGRQGRSARLEALRSRDYG